MYPAGPPGLDRSEPRGQTCLHFRQVTVAGSSSGDWVRTCGPGSPHAGHVPRYISSALTAASSWGKTEIDQSPRARSSTANKMRKTGGAWYDVHGTPKTSSRLSRSCRRSIPGTPNRRAERTAYFGSTTTGRSSAQSGAREGLSEMGRRQSAKNARRFSPRRRPAERTRRPSCRHARGRGEPLLRPEAVGPARYSGHAESLACAARAFTSPSRFHCPIMALIGPSDLPWMPSRKPKIRLRKGRFTGHGGFIRGDSSGPRRAVASHSGTPSGTLAFSHCEFLTSAG